MKEHTLGFRLLELRQDHDLTQKQLCEQLSISRSAYSYYETGSRIPDISTLIMIAEFYDVTLDELINSNDYNRDDHNNSDKHLSDSITNVKLLHHLTSKHIPVDKVMELSKADFDLLMDFKNLTEENRAELHYLMKYKLRKQSNS